MKAEYAQNIALVAHGNAFLCGLSPAPELSESNSSFHHVSSVSFRVKPRWHVPLAPKRWITVASGTAQWFRALKKEGAERLQFVIPPAGDYNLAGFVGGAPTGIVVEPSPEAAGWVATWSLIEPRPADGPIWNVVYQPEPGFGSLAMRVTSLAEAIESLHSALTDAADFSTRHDLRSWTEYFVEAQTLLHHPVPVVPYYADLLPSIGYPLAARQLLAACARAWVFGGMGWWNDMGFDDPDLQLKYDHVTDELWLSLLKGLSTGANAFDANP
jgi:hypothetical protein